MKFTDRYIEFPIQVYNTKQKELTGVEILKDSYIKINPLEISSYRPYFNDEEPGVKATTITTKNGDTTVLCVPIEEFKKTVNNHMK